MRVKGYTRKASITLIQFKIDGCDRSFTATLPPPSWSQEFERLIPPPRIPVKSIKLTSGRIEDRADELDPIYQLELKQRDFKRVVYFLYRLLSTCEDFEIENTHTKFKVIIPPPLSVDRNLSLNAKRWIDAFSDELAESELGLDVLMQIANEAASIQFEKLLKEKKVEILQEESGGGIATG